MLNKLFYMVQRAYGDIPAPLPTPEEWSKRHASKGCPDTMIAAAIVRSFATHPDDWKVKVQNGNYDKKGNPALSNTRDQFYTFMKDSIYHTLGETVYLKNEQTDVLFSVHSTGPYNARTLYFKVNNVKIEDSLGQYILDNWKSLNQRRKAAIEAAERAKREAEENEAKWELVEKLLKMKRNEQGALVPIQEVKHEISI